MSDAARRYWAEQLDAAVAFCAAVRDHPLDECGEPFADLLACAGEAGVDLALAPRPRIFALRASVAERVVAAAAAMQRRGWRMTIEDAYRTPAMQRDLALEPAVLAQVVERVRWETGLADPPPELVARRLDVLVAALPKTAGHVAGAAVDISVHDRRSGHELDRGGPYLELSERTPMGSPFVSRDAAANRAAITELMAAHGLHAYPFEFWHYSAGDGFARVAAGDAAAARYGPVERAGDAPVPLGDVLRRFVDVAELG